MDHTFETPHPVKLYVEIGSGQLSAEATDTARDTGTTSIVLSGPGADQTEVVQDGDQISIIGPSQRAGFLGGDRRVMAEVTVPTSSQLITKLGSADQSARGTWTMVKAKGGSGDVAIEHVTGPCVVATGSGDATIDRADGDLRVKSGSGDVRVRRTAATAGISTGSGDVAIEETSASTVVKTGSGDVEVADSRADLSVSTGSGDTRVRLQHRGSVGAKTASGRFQVGVPTGIPVWTDISTVSGRIRSSLEGAGQPAEGEDYIEIRAKTASGDIVLEQR